VSDTLIKIDSMEQGIPLTIESDLAHLAGALRSNGNERSARSVDAAKETIERLTSELAAMKAERDNLRKRAEAAESAGDAKDNMLRLEYARAEAAEKRLEEVEQASSPVTVNPDEDDALLGADGLPWPKTFDGQTWAKEFVRRFQKHPQIATDEATMIGWFANAIMVGFDRAQQKPDAGKGEGKT
jgi:hypothetical protein